MSSLSDYLIECRQLRGVGVEETSYYPALKALLDAAGKELKPPVVFVQHPKGVEGSQPDGGLFPANHLPKAGQVGLPFDDPNAR